MRTRSNCREIPVAPTANEPLNNEIWKRHPEEKSHYRILHPWECSLKIHSDNPGMSREIFLLFLLSKCSFDIIDILRMFWGDLVCARISWDRFETMRDSFRRDWRDENPPEGNATRTHWNTRYIVQRARSVDLMLGKSIIRSEFREKSVCWGKFARGFSRSPVPVISFASSLSAASSRRY
jgi:hypothetical protein